MFRPGMRVRNRAGLKVFIIHEIYKTYPDGSVSALIRPVIDNLVFPGFTGVVKNTAEIIK